MLKGLLVIAMVRAMELVAIHALGGYISQELAIALIRLVLLVAVILNQVVARVINLHVALIVIAMMIVYLINVLVKKPVIIGVILILVHAGVIFHRMQSAKKIHV